MDGPFSPAARAYQRKYLATTSFPPILEDAEGEILLCADETTGCGDLAEVVPIRREFRNQVLDAFGQEQRHFYLSIVYDDVSESQPVGLRPAYDSL
jgi:transposase-like protein